MNFRIINRKAATGARIYKWNPSVSKTCHICNQDEDEIHLFVECNNVRTIWDVVSITLKMKIKA